MVLQKQTSVALSTCEAEYVAASLALKEACWLQIFMADVTTKKKRLSATLYVDNKGAIDVAQDIGKTKYRKQIGIRRHYLCYHVKHGTGTVKHIKTYYDLADRLRNHSKRRATTESKQEWKKAISDRQQRHWGTEGYGGAQIQERNAPERRQQRIKTCNTAAHIYYMYGTICITVRKR